MTTSVLSVRRPRSLQVERAHRHDLVAVDDPARCIHCEHSVGVTVEREPDVGSRREHGLANAVRMLRPTAIVDVATVGRDVDRDDVRTQRLERPGSDGVRGAVGPVDDQRHPVEAAALHRRDQPVDVAIAEPLVDRHVTGLRRGLEVVLVEVPLDLRLHLVRQLAATCREQLDAVVLVRVVRGGDDGCRRIPLTRGVRHRGRGEHTEQRDVCTFVDETCRQRGFDAGPRLSRVATDHPAPRAEDACRGAAQRPNFISRQCIGSGTDTVRAEAQAGLRSHLALWD